ncbi:MAG: PIN domain-containing protein [Bryobacteraceae bacterium]
MATIFSVMPVSAAMFLRARRIAEKRMAGLRVRSLDVLHVAAALTLGASAFLTFDKRQQELARLEGLRIR